jgi:hypothetical protein
MNDALHAFMNEVLGEDATTALVKAGDRSEALAAIVGPRTVVGWVNLASRWSYDGVVPGHEGSFLQFQKNETGLTGAVAMGDQQLDFENAQPEHLAAMLCVGLGCPPDLMKSEGATQVALAQLGETIDLMVKAHLLTLLKAEPKAGERCPKCHSKDVRTAPAGVKCGNCGTNYSPQEGDARETKKAELPGKAAGAIPPDGPEGQEAPQSKAPRRMATAKPTQLTLTKSMSERKCSVCESSQFSKGELKGCYCLRALARFTKSEPKGDGYLVTFGPEWSKSQIRLFLDIVGEEE